jgi:hypothetical protein
MRGPQSVLLSLKLVLLLIVQGLLLRGDLVRWRGSFHGTGL